MGAYGAEKIAAAEVRSDWSTQRSGEDRKRAAEQRSESDAVRSHCHEVR
jgi:hypothetical protein